MLTLREHTQWVHVLVDKAKQHIPERRLETEYYLQHAQKTTQELLTTDAYLEEENRHFREFIVIKEGPYSFLSMLSEEAQP